MWILVLLLLMASLLLTPVPAESDALLCHIRIRTSSSRPPAMAFFRPWFEQLLLPGLDALLATKRIR
jgi:hypothetical protein